MRKTAFLVGFGAGYVLGARAGRERYDQIRAMFGQVADSPKVQQAAEKAKEVAEVSGKRSLAAVQSGVEKAGSVVKDRLNKDDATTDPWRGNEVPDTAEGQLP